MYHRRGQAPVAIVTAHKKIETLSRDPLLDARAEMLFPRKRSVRFSLVLAVNPQRVVHCRAPESIPFHAITGVLVSARVDEQRSPVTLQAYTQRIGMLLPAAPGNARPACDHQRPSMRRQRAA